MRIYKQGGLLVPLTTSTAFSLSGFRKRYPMIAVFFNGENADVYADFQVMQENARYYYRLHTEKPEALNEQRRKFKQSSEKIERLYRQLYYVDPEEFSLQDILKLNDKALKLMDEYWETCLFIDSFDSGIDRKIVEKISNKYSLTSTEIDKLTRADHLTFTQQKHLELLKIALRYFKENESTKQQLEAFLKSGDIKKLKEDYDWYLSSYAKVNHITDQEIRKETHDILEDKLRSAKELRDLDQYSKKINQDIKLICKNYNLDKNPLSYLQLLTVWREERKRVTLMSVHIVDFIARTLSIKTGIDYQNILFADLIEVPDIVDGKLSDSELKQRRQSGLIYWTKDNQQYCYVGEQAWTVQRQLEHELKGQMGSSELKGRVACQGVVTGRVAVVLTVDDFGKVRNGDILVAHMTRPDFLPVMNKAVAFVTDEGGISCHAAIVSREMNKPCIVGTRMATSLLNDGDMVEVDATKGVVRRI